MPKAILSVHNKTGLVEFAAGLHAAGWTLIASGGTANLLRQHNLPVSEVAEYTGSPEILNGRVKTLHPAIHGGLLARSAADAPDHQAELHKLGWDYIDLAVVNLYPFEETVARPGSSQAEIIENIDIGGVALIRAAAKNHGRVTLICDPADYPAVLSELQTSGPAQTVSAETRLSLARKGFAHTAHYDAAIANWFTHAGQAAAQPSDAAPMHLTLYPVSVLRYGENPHQHATLYGYTQAAGPLGGTVLQGKALSYNNLLDLDAAWRVAVSYERPTIAIVKHLSPCGIASGEQLSHAFPHALASDPISAFGGVIAANRPFDGAVAAELGELFVECIAAPGFSSEALAILAKRKNLRLVNMPDTSLSPAYELRSINQGILQQSIDMGDPDGAEWKVVTTRQPTPAELQDLRFAWTACQHVKSNAIVLASGQATVGIGGGQPNRVDCVRIAAQRAGRRSIGSVMASDAFFPFPDSVEEAAKAGVTAIVQPGGSVRDQEAIAAAEQHGIAMLVTGVRHFRH